MEHVVACVCGNSVFLIQCDSAVHRTTEDEKANAVTARVLPFWAIDPDEGEFRALVWSALPHQGERILAVAGERARERESERARERESERERERESERARERESQSPFHQRPKSCRNGRIYSVAGGPRQSQSAPVRVHQQPTGERAGLGHLYRPAYVACECECEPTSASAESSLTGGSESRTVHLWRIPFPSDHQKGQRHA